MKNKEFYKDEIVDISINKWSAVAVNKETGKPCACDEIDCGDCISASAEDGDCYSVIKEWAEQEYNAYMNLKVDTPILVSNDGVIWYKRHFAKCERNLVYAYLGGRTSFTATDIKSWAFAKLPSKGE